MRLLRGRMNASSLMADTRQDNLIAKKTHKNRHRARSNCIIWLVNTSEPNDGI